MCNTSKYTQFNIIYKTEEGLRLKNGGNKKKDIFTLYVDNKCFQSDSLMRKFRSTIMEKNTSSYYVKTLLLDAGFNMPHSH